MSKTKNFCKKPLLFLSLGLIVVFAVALIILSCVPYAATPYRYQNEDGTRKVTYVFKKDKYEVTTETKSDLLGENVNKNEFEYIIEDGVAKYANTKIEIGKIDAYTLTIGDTVYKNAFAKTLQIVSIVGVSLGGVGLVLYFVLNANKSSGTKSTKKTSKKK